MAILTPPLTLRKRRLCFFGALFPSPPSRFPSPDGERVRPDRVGGQVRREERQNGETPRANRAPATDVCPPRLPRPPPPFSRCFPLWTDFSEVGEGGMCRQKQGRTRRPATRADQPSPPLPPLPPQCMRETDDPRKCKAKRDDYLECLHHRKEVRGNGREGRWRFLIDAAVPDPVPFLPPPPFSVHPPQRHLPRAEKGGGRGQGGGGRGRTLRERTSVCFFYFPSHRVQLNPIPPPFSCRLAACARSASPIAYSDTPIKIL